MKCIYLLFALTEVEFLPEVYGCLVNLFPANTEKNGRNESFKYDVNLNM